MDSKPFFDSYRGLNSSYLRLVDSLSALRALSSISVQQCNDHELLENALQALAENQDLECCSIFLLQDETLTNVVGIGCSSVYESSSDNCPMSFRIGEGIVGLAAQSGELMHCKDCHSEAVFVPYGSAKEREVGMVAGSVICAPIKSGDDVLGVLNVSHPHSGFFDQSHERSLRLYSDVLGQLLTNNRLFHQMDMLVQQRTSQLQKALDDAEDLRRRDKQLSIVDELTQLHNRRFFFPEAHAALARSLRYELPFALLLLDVDHFKSVNDNYGHTTGDVVLQQVATTLRSQIREGDILARFGGEEFILALPNTDNDGAMILAERIRLAVKECNWELASRSLTVSVSIGLAGVADFSHRDAQKQLDELIKQADQALYFGKQHGRDQTCNYAEIACDV